VQKFKEDPTTIDFAFLSSFDTPTTYTAVNENVSVISIVDDEYVFMFAMDFSGATAQQGPSIVNVTSITMTKGETATGRISTSTPAIFHDGTQWLAIADDGTFTVAPSNTGMYYLPFTAQNDQGYTSGVIPVEVTP
jgi:hypothetical protein